MATYGSQTVNKRQKTASSRETGQNVECNDFFPGINRIEYKPDASVEDTLCFHYYNSAERIHGRTMEEWLRPSISFWNVYSRLDNNVKTSGNVRRSWDDGTHTQENIKRRLKAAFEFYYKLGIKHWTFEDHNISVEGSTGDENTKNMDEITNLLMELQLQTGVKPLWVTSDLKSHTRYAQGAFTNPEANIVSTAAVQVKKSMELAHRLGAECFLIKDANEGYNHIVNTDISRELRHYSRLLKITADYKERINYRGQLLFQPRFQDSNHQNLQHSYASSALAALCLLRHYGAERHYKLDIQPSNEVFLASAYGAFGCLEITDPVHYQDAAFPTLLMKTVIEQGGLQPGGLNIDINKYKNIFDFKDMFSAYINAIDLYARGLRNASKLISDGMFVKNLQQRYLSFHTGFGSRIASGEVDLEDCEDHIHRQSGDANVSLGQTEHWKSVFTHYL